MMEPERMVMLGLRMLGLIVIVGTDCDGAPVLMASCPNCDYKQSVTAVVMVMVMSCRNDKCHSLHYPAWQECVPHSS